MGKKSMSIMLIYFSYIIKKMIIYQIINLIFAVINYN